MDQTKSTNQDKHSKKPVEKNIERDEPEAVTGKRHWWQEKPTTACIFVENGQKAHSAAEQRQLLIRLWDRQRQAPQHPELQPRRITWRVKEQQEWIRAPVKQQRKWLSKRFVKSSTTELYSLKGERWPPKAVWTITDRFQLTSLNSDGETEQRKRENSHQVKVRASQF